MNGLNNWGLLPQSVQQVLHFRHSPSSCTRENRCFAIPRSDNALAKSVNGLYKAAVIDYLKHTWEGVNDVALDTLDWVHWYNHERLDSKNGYLLPIDAENIYYSSLKPSGYAA